MWALNNPLTVGRVLWHTITQPRVYLTAWLLMSFPIVVWALWGATPPAGPQDPNLSCTSWRPGHMAASDTLAVADFFRRGAARMVADPTEDVIVPQEFAASYCAAIMRHGHRNEPLLMLNPRLLTPPVPGAKRITIQYYPVVRDSQGDLRWAGSHAPRGGDADDPPLTLATRNIRRPVDIKRYMLMETALYEKAPLYS